MDRSPTSQLTRTCPWCATARVIAFGEEGVVRALSRHLETCSGENPDGGASQTG